MFSRRHRRKERMLAGGKGKPLNIPPCDRFSIKKNHSVTSQITQYTLNQGCLLYTSLPCLEKRVSIWSKKPHPVSILLFPLPSTFRRIQICVSAVFLFISLVLMTCLPQNLLCCIKKNIHLFRRTDGHSVIVSNLICVKVSD